ncbi:MAG: hypothetical protein JRF27_03335 [Deltaproteobacteria bacterium]|nr:hypothetical protein [Deltaproteobacteria bacterium]
MKIDENVKTRSPPFSLPLNPFHPCCRYKHGKATLLHPGPADRAFHDQQGQFDEEGAMEFW